MTESEPGLGRKGTLVVISGPSGVGKTTIARAVEKAFDEAVFSVSATTRPITAADIEGRDYFFLTDEEFQGRVKAGDMLEHAQVFGRHWYGTPRSSVEHALESGRMVILDIDVQGGLQIRESMPSAYMLFIVPPSDDELLRRLRSRGREDEATIQRRFAEAKSEIDTARTSGAYDVLVVNADLDAAIEEVCNAIRTRACVGG